VYHESKKTMEKPLTSGQAAEERITTGSPKRGKNTSLRGETSVTIQQTGRQEKDVAGKAPSGTRGISKTGLHWENDILKCQKILYGFVEAG